MSRDIRDIRKQAQIAARAARRESLARKVWLIPADLEVRLLKFQVAKCLPTEVAAARELLSMALDMWESGS